MHPFLPLAARLVLGSTWMLAGLAKLVRKEPPGQAVAGSGLVPRFAAPIIAAALPWIELGLGSLLLAGKWTALAALGSAALLGVFSLVLGVKLARGERIECRCFGHWSRGPASGWTVVRNAGLIGL